MSVCYNIKMQSVSHIDVCMCSSDPEHTEAGGWRRNPTDTNATDTNGSRGKIRWDPGPGNQVNRWPCSDSLRHMPTNALGRALLERAVLYDAERCRWRSGQGCPFEAGDRGSSHYQRGWEQFSSGASAHQADRGEQAGDNIVNMMCRLRIGNGLLVVLSTHLASVICQTYKRALRRKYATSELTVRRFTLGCISAFVV